MVDRCTVHRSTRQVRQLSFNFVGRRAGARTKVLGMAPRRRTTATTSCLLQRAHKADFGDGASLVQALAASSMVIMSLPPHLSSFHQIGFKIRVASFRFAID